MVGPTTERATFEVPAWLPADTEESVMGTQWHQEATDAMATMIVEAGRRHGSDWGVARGIALLATGARYPDGKSYDPKPDVMVLPQPLPSGNIAGISLTEAGIPLFIAEVASKSTFGADMGLKKEVYAFVGVHEYIVFDPTGDLIAPALHAWRIEEGDYVPWVAGDDGWWHSRALGITFQPTQPFITLRDRDGAHVSLPRQAFAREHAFEHELAEARQRIAEMEAELRRLQGH